MVRRAQRDPVSIMIAAREKPAVRLLLVLVLTGLAVTSSVPGNPPKIRADEADVAVSKPDHEHATAAHLVYLPMGLKGATSLSPIVSSFRAIPDTIDAGDSSLLLWSIEGPVDSLVLKPGIGDVTREASWVVSPTKTTTYTLIARNSGVTRMAQVMVTVRQPPVIAEFTASPDTIGLGETVTLSWSIENSVDSLSIQPGIGDVTGRSEVVFSPKETTIYVLTARNSVGTSTAQVEVRVSRRLPIITAFTATPDTIDLGDCAALSWSIENYVTSLSLTPGVGDVTGQTGASVCPSNTTTYFLTAHNAVGTNTARVTVEVKKDPTIVDFRATPRTINPGDPVTLSWDVQNQVESLTLEPDIGDVTGQSGTTVSPMETTTYTLIARNPAGSDSAQAVVTVNTTGLPLELLVFDWDGPVTKAEHGFPRDDPPMESANGDWTQPINYAQGRLYYRAEIRSQPVPQQMKLQFCFWQYNNTLENCGPQRQLYGSSGTVVPWSAEVQNMWKKDGNPIDWVNPRDKNGVAIKNSDGEPVSDYLGWDWNGEDPDQWYPLDMRFTVVVVADGAVFSGWEDWITP